MAETTEIAVEASGFDKLVTKLGAVEKASEGTRKAIRTAFAAEVLTQGIDRIGQAIGGVGGASVTAAGNIVKGFIAGGPVGLAIAATTVAFELLFKVIDYGNERLKEQDEIMGRIAIERVERARQVRRAEEATARASADFALALLDAGEEKIKEAEARAQKRREEARRQREQDAQDAIDSTTRDIEAEYAAKRVETERQEREFADFLAASTALIQSDARAKAEATKRQVDARMEQAARLADLKAFADEATALTNELEAELVTSADATNKAIGETIGVGAARAVDALTAMDAAQLAAAASAGTLASSLAAAAAEGVSAELQAIAQSETVKALAAGAAALGRLAIGDATGAGIFGLEAAQHGAAAVAAGAGAVALNTAASAVRPPAQATGGQGAATPRGAGGGSSGGGGVMIVVNTDKLFATEADVGRGVEKARAEYARYRGL